MDDTGAACSDKAPENAALQPQRLQAAYPAPPDLVHELLRHMLMPRAHPLSRPAIAEGLLTGTGRQPSTGTPLRFCGLSTSQEMRTQPGAQVKRRCPHRCG